MTDELLLQVRKPARYIGQEWNVAKKDFLKAQVKFALAFPDLYEIGMSNLGIRILYGILNNSEGVLCERFFACDVDMESVLRNNNLALASLESKRLMREFDFIGFSLGYELSYTNVLNMLDLGGVPLRSAERGADFPLVIAGGPCVMNPEPMHEFFDLFVIGEAEEVIGEIVNTYRQHRGSYKTLRMNKLDLLMILAQIEGVYVPSFYEVSYNDQGRVIEFKAKHESVPLKVRKRFVENFEQAYFPVDWVVPYIQVVHDRLAIETMRGCPNTCRFCQAKMQYYPVRYRSAQKIINLACEAYRNSGYDEISFYGLSVSDHPHIEEVLRSLVGTFKNSAVSLSLPSVKPKSMLGSMATLIASIKKTGLTFAPEAATDKMRKVLGKDFDMAQFTSCVESAYLAGYQHIKLYFMIGLPFEEPDDLDAILGFAAQISQLRRKVTNRGPANINISINTLIPKPHTPMQWFGMLGLDQMRRKQEFIRGKSRNRNIKINFHNPQMSILEGIFSRGDRLLAPVILSAFKKGARFDAWGEHFKFDLWAEAFADCGIDYSVYLRLRDAQEILPWDFIDIGVSKDYLGKEFDKIIAIK
jgi:radical SAM family uncharacterized protein